MAMLTQVKVDSTTHDIAIPYAVCSTAAATVAKTVDYANFSLETGSQIKVSFTYANTATSPTLNVNSTGAKAIVGYGTTGMTTGWKAGAVLDLTYNGTSWVITSFGGLADASCSCSVGALSKGTASGGGLTGGGLSGGGLSLGTATAPTVDIFETASSSQDANVTLSKVDVGDKDATNYPYYFKVSATSTGGGNTVTRAAVTRAIVERAKFSQDVTQANGTCTHTAGYLAAGSHSIAGATKATVELAYGSIAADSTTIGQTSKTATAADGSKTEYVKLAAGTVSTAVGALSQSGNSGGALSGGDLSLGTATAPTVDISEVADTDTDGTYHNVDLSVVDVGDSKSTSTYPYYWRVKADSTGGGNTVTRAIVNRSKFTNTVSQATGTCTRTEGWITGGTQDISGATATTITLDAGSIASDSKTATAADGTKTEYMMMKAATLSNLTLDTTSTSAVPLVTSSGYAASKKYATAFTVPANTTLTTYTNTGTTTTVANAGTIGTLSGDGGITTWSGTGTVTNKTGASTIINNTNSLTITNNTGDGYIPVGTNASGCKVVVTTNNYQVNTETNNDEVNVNDNTSTGTVIIGTNAGTVNINGGGSVDKGVSVVGKVVTVDGGTAVTNSSGDLITVTYNTDTVNIVSSEQYVPLVNADGWAVKNYIETLAVPASHKFKRLEVTDSTSTVGVVANYGTISEVSNSSTGAITALSNMGAIDELTNDGAGGITLITNSGTISTLNNNSSSGGSLIGTLDNSSGTIDTFTGTSSTINTLTGSTSITSFGTSSTTASLTINNSMSGSVYFASGGGSNYATVTWTSGAPYIYLPDNTNTAATMGPDVVAVYGTSGSLWVGRTSADSHSSYISTVTLRGYESSYYDYISTLNIGTSTTYKYAKITTLNDYGTITKLNVAGGIIGDSTTSTSSSTGQNGLFGTGTVYVAATGASTSTRTTSSYRLASLVLKAGASTTYTGSYIASMPVGNYAAIGDMTVGTGASVSISSNAGTVKYLDWTLSESGTTLTFTY